MVQSSSTVTISRYTDAYSSNDLRVKLIGCITCHTIVLDLGGAEIGREGAVVVADVIGNMAALTSLNISSNKLVSIVDYKYTPEVRHEQRDSVMCEGVLCPVKTIWKSGYVYKLVKVHGVLALANAIKYHKTLKLLNISDNCLCNPGVGSILSDMLVGNTVLKELDVSNNTCYENDSFGYVQETFVRELAEGLLDNQGVETLNLSYNGIASKEAGKILSDVLMQNTVLKHLDVSNNLIDRDFRGVSNYLLDQDLSLRGGNAYGSRGSMFAWELAVGLRANHTLSSLDIRQHLVNNIHSKTSYYPVPIPIEGLQAIAEALQTNVSCVQCRL